MVLIINHVHHKFILITINSSCTLYKSVKDIEKDILCYFCHIFVPSLNSTQCITFLLLLFHFFCSSFPPVSLSNRQESPILFIHTTHIQRLKLHNVCSSLPRKMDREGVCAVPSKKKRVEYFLTKYIFFSNNHNIKYT